MNDDEDRYDRYPYEPGFVAGSDTSAAAAESLDDVVGKRREALVLLVDHEPRGLTSDELEVLTGWLHQSASARLRELVLQGHAYDSEERRMTRYGRMAVVRRAASDG